MSWPLLGIPLNLHTVTALVAISAAVVIYAQVAPFSLCRIASPILQNISRHFSFFAEPGGQPNQQQANRCGQGCGEGVGCLDEKYLKVFWRNSPTIDQVWLDPTRLYTVPSRLPVQYITHRRWHCLITHGQIECQITTTMKQAAIYLIFEGCQRFNSHCDLTLTTVKVTLMWLNKLFLLEASNKFVKSFLESCSCLWILLTHRPFLTLMLNQSLTKFSV